MKKPTEQEIAAAKKLAGASGVDEVRLVEAGGGLVSACAIVRKLSTDEFRQYIDMRIKRKVEADSFALSRALLWPTSKDGVPDLDGLRAQLPACEPLVASFVLGLSGASASKPEIEEATAPDLIAAGMPEAEALALLAAHPGERALAIVRQRKFGLTCVIMRPDPETFDALQDRAEQAARSGGMFGVCLSASASVVWCREPIAAVLERLPGLAEDLYEAVMRLGGFGAELTSKRL